MCKYIIEMLYDVMDNPIKMIIWNGKEKEDYALVARSMDLHYKDKSSNSSLGL